MQGASRGTAARGRAPAAPYMSDDADAAVGLALGTLSVAVSATYTPASGRPSAAAATCATLVCRPCARRAGGRRPRPYTRVPTLSPKSDETSAHGLASLTRQCMQPFLNSRHRHHRRRQSGPTQPPGAPGPASPACAMRMAPWQEPHSRPGAGAWRARAWPISTPPCVSSTVPRCRRARARRPAERRVRVRSGWSRETGGCACTHVPTGSCDRITWCSCKPVWLCDLATSPPCVNNTGTGPVFGTADCARATLCDRSAAARRRHAKVNPALPRRGAPGSGTWW